MIEEIRRAKAKRPKSWVRDYSRGGGGKFGGEKSGKGGCDGVQKHFGPCERAKKSRAIGG